LPIGGFLIFNNAPILDPPSLGHLKGGVHPFRTTHSTTHSCRQALALPCSRLNTHLFSHKCHGTTRCLTSYPLLPPVAAEVSNHAVLQSWCCVVNNKCASAPSCWLDKLPATHTTTGPDWPLQQEKMAQVQTNLPRRAAMQIGSAASPHESAATSGEPDHRSLSGHP
jgi:hypothetical protein